MNPTQRDSETLWQLTLQLYDGESPVLGDLTEEERDEIEQNLSLIQALRSDADIVLPTHAALDKALESLPNGNAISSSVQPLQRKYGWFSFLFAPRMKVLVPTLAVLLLTVAFWRPWAPELLQREFIAADTAPSMEIDTFQATGEGGEAPLMMKSRIVPEVVAPREQLIREIESEIELLQEEMEELHKLNAPLFTRDDFYPHA